MNDDSPKSASSVESSRAFAPPSKAWVLVIMTLVLLLAAVLRLYGLNNLSPPGLEHDEVAHWLINRDILAGNHAIYFEEAYGHEAGFHYLQSGFMLLLGDNVLALRLPSAFLGLILVAVTYALINKLFGRWIALFSAALGAVVFWPIFFSRLALRAISLPLLSALAVLWWWRAWQLASDHKENRSPSRYYLLGGLTAGLSLHTYMASRALPIFFVLFILYLFLFHRRRLVRQGRGILLFFAAYALVSAPLVVFLLAHPGAEHRIGEVDAPLRALLSGDLWPVVQNTLKITGMFAFRGDPLWRQNIANLPVFDPLIGFFFYLGLLVSLWKWREPRYIFLILWLFTASIPSIVTIDAPSYIRIIIVLPLLGVFPAIGAQVIHRFKHLSTLFPQLSPDRARFSLLIGLFAIVMTHSIRSANALFVTWPAEDEVQFVWQAALTDAAAFLNERGPIGPVAIGGWTPETMDPPTMALTLRREDLDLRYFDPQQSVIVPSAPDEGTPILIRPSILNPPPYLESWLAAKSSQIRRFDTFVVYSLPPDVRVDLPCSVQETFGDELTLLGYERQPECSADDDMCWMATYWRTRKASIAPRRFFLHRVGPGGVLLAQDDRLGAPPEYWRDGDLLIQLHWLPPAESGWEELRLGYYNPQTDFRLVTEDGSDYVILERKKGAG